VTGRAEAGIPGWAALVRAPNPGPMTLDGTNTWVLRAPGAEGCVVVDPGPLDPAHLEAVAAHGPVLCALLTHGHPDHAEGAGRFHELTGAPVLAAGPQYSIGGETLDGQPLELAGLAIRTLRTPGHTADSVSFAVTAPDGSEAVLTGDTILGRGTTVIDHPDGALGPYLDSLRRLADLAPGTAVLPGHGPELPDAPAVAAAYLAHREQRLEQVRAALGTLGADASARQVVELVYADVDESLWPAAEWSVEAQLAHLRA
jgi:glyoxylase-like metal-dependent hydrolase (beta-lactamase superfamily II)